MVAYPIPKRLIPALAPATAGLVGVCVALACMLMPSDVLEIIVLDSGIPALLPAAAPPLGWTARTALAMIAGGGAAAVSWLAVYLLLGSDAVESPAPKLPVESKPIFTLPKMPKFSWPSLPSRAPDKTAVVPVLRRADAHPDAPPRAPLLATRDLGTPFLDVRAPKAPPVECDLPRDLDAPLSAFDPDAIPVVAADPVRAVTPLSPVRGSAIQQEGERFEAYVLRPPVAAKPAEPPIAAPRTDATIHALLDRLERGVTARAAAAPKPASVDTALDDLRRLATR